MTSMLIKVITNPFCDEVNPALGAPLPSLPLLKVNCPSLLSHHTVQTVGGGMDPNLWLKIVLKDFLEAALYLQRNWGGECVLAKPNIT